MKTREFEFLDVWWFDFNSFVEIQRQKTKKGLCHFELLLEFVCSCVTVWHFVWCVVCCVFRCWCAFIMLVLLSWACEEGWILNGWLCFAQLFMSQWCSVCPLRMRRYTLDYITTISNSMNHYRIRSTNVEFDHPIANSIMLIIELVFHGVIIIFWFGVLLIVNMW
jgi:hypothetical protein